MINIGKSTFLKVVTGKAACYRSKSSLLDGNIHSESHTQAEKEDKKVIRNLHKRSGRTKQPSKGKINSRVDEIKAFEPPEAGDPLLFLEVVRSTRVLSMGPSIFRAPTASRKKVEKHVAFHPSEDMYELPAAGIDEEQREKALSMKLAERKDWELVRGGVSSVMCLQSSRSHIRCTRIKP